MLLLLEPCLKLRLLEPWLLLLLLLEPWLLLEYWRVVLLNGQSVRHHILHASERVHLLLLVRVRGRVNERLLGLDILLAFL